MGPARHARSLLPHRSEVATLVQKTKDRHFRLLEAVHEAVRIDLKFSNRGVIELGDDAAALAELIKGFRGIEQPL